MLCSNRLSYVAKGAIDYLKTVALDKSRCIACGYALTLNVKAEMHDITVLHVVILAFQTQFSSLFCAMLAPVANEVVVRDHLGADKALLEISVNFSGGLWRGGTDVRSPGTDLFYPGGEIGLQLEKLVSGANYAVQPGLVETQVIEIGPGDNE